MIYWLAESDEPFDLFMKYLFGEWLFPCKQTETQAQNHRTGRDFKGHWLQSTPNAGIYRKPVQNLLKVIADCEVYYGEDPEPLRSETHFWFPD